MRDHLRPALARPLLPRLGDAIRFLDEHSAKRRPQVQAPETRRAVRVPAEQARRDALEANRRGDFATARNLVFLVDFQTRAHPAYQEVVRWVHSGRIGRC